MPVQFLPEEEIYPPDGASLDQVAVAFVSAVRQTRVVTHETIHRWADAFERALPEPVPDQQPVPVSEQRSRWS
jgi:hypothetical protein